jgi:hypothetical protein
MTKQEQKIRHHEAVAAAKLNKMREQVIQHNMQQEHKRNTNKVAMAWELVKTTFSERDLSKFDMSTDIVIMNNVFENALYVSESFLNLVDEKFNPKQENSNVEQSGNTDSGTNVEPTVQEPSV